jgi:riboflavin kinase/FMN adenylyltransferase
MSGFDLTGIVVAGDRRGRTIGFPTANIVPAASMSCPEPGVYAALADGRAAAVNVGVRPSFPGATPGLLIEVHILDFDGDLYGRRLHIRFVERLRPERRFASPDELVAQLQRDVATVRESLGKWQAP